MSSLGVLLGAWAAFLVGAVVLWGVVTLLGVGILAALRTPKGYWLLLGGPIGLGAIGVSTLAAALLGVFWAPWVPLMFSAALMLGAWILGRRLGSDGGEGPPEPSSFWWIFAGTIIFTGVQFGVTMLFMHWPNAVPIMGDAQFHLAGSELVMESGNVNPLTALGQLYEPSLEVSNHYYPVFWHALVALLAPFTGIPLAHNLWMFVLGFLVWPVSLGGLALQLAPKRPWVGFAAPVLAVSALAFPVENLVGISLGPFTAGVVLVVPSIALVLLTDREPLRWWLPLAVLVVAGFTAHPSTGVLVAIPVIALLTVRLVGMLTRMQNKLAVGLIATGLLGTLSLGAVFVMRLPVYQNLAAYERVTEGIPSGVATLLGRGLFGVSFSVGWILTAFLAVVGAYALRRSREALLTLVAAAPYLFLYLASTAQDGFLREMTGLWWKDYSRLIVPNLAVIVVFGAVGATSLGAILLRKRWGRRGKRSAALVSVSVSLAVAATGLIGQKPDRLSTLAFFARQAYSLDPVDLSPLDEDGVAVLEGLDQAFSEGCVVGAHASGVGFTPVYSDLISCMPMPRPYTEDQAYLQAHFRDIHSDPRICEIVNENQIVGFIEKPPPDEYTEKAQAGLYNVDTSKGFVLLEESGPVRLWEITACD